jgi:hypothetical protein
MRGWTEREMVSCVVAAEASACTRAQFQLGAALHSQQWVGWQWKGWMRVGYSAAWPEWCEV